ncbi:MAG: ABC transporter ATP-binding protein [Thermoplasmatota archaeon]
MTEPFAVECRGLSKTFGQLKAVDGVTFHVRRGEVFALLGPNGAGKSTTIRMLCTLTKPSGGTAFVAGHDCAREPAAVCRSIGVVFQDRTLDDNLTAEENLRFQAVLYGIPSVEIPVRISRVLALVELEERRHDRVGTFSGGMARRLELARAFLHAPDVLFLDEPTLGLDPQTRTRMWQELLRLRKESGVAVVLTTHYLEEAENADRIAIIDRGRIVAMGTPGELKAQIGHDTIYLSTADDAAALAALTAAGHEARLEEGGVAVATPDGEGQLVAVLKALDVPVRTVRVRRPALDDVFLHFTGHKIRAEAGDDLAMTRNILGAMRQ